MTVILAVIGSDSYGILRNLVQPDLQKDKSYDKNVRLLMGHHIPKPMVNSEWFKFNKRNQREGENIADYVVA